MNQEIINNFPNLATQMTPLAYNYLQNIINAMPSTTQAVVPSTTIGPCPIKVEICKDGVRAIETQILNDTQLNAEEKVILLMSASVARHSYAYWTMVWKDTNDAWWGIMGGHNPNFDVRETANPDVGGAVVGAVWYTVGSLVTGSDWTWSGCGWAALGGAISGSCGLAVKIGKMLIK